MLVLQFVYAKRLLCPAGALVFKFRLLCLTVVVLPQNQDHYKAEQVVLILHCPFACVNSYSAYRP